MPKKLKDGGAVQSYSYKSSHLNKQTKHLKLTKYQRTYSQKKGKKMNTGLLKILLT